MWQHKNQKLAALAVALLAMKPDTRKAVVEAQAAMVLTDCLRRSKGEGAAQLLRIAAAAALTPIAQDDKSRSKVKLAGEGWEGRHAGVGSDGQARPADVVRV